MKPIKTLAGLADPARPVRRSTFLSLAAILVVLDQLSKLSMVWLLGRAAGDGRPAASRLLLRRFAGESWESLAASYGTTAEYLVAAVHALANIPLVPGLLGLQYAENTGAAFSFASGHTWLLALFSALISAVILVIAWRLPASERGLRIPLGLILGGAIGNLIDRARLGYVVDFIDAHWFDKAHWPTFNVADSAICIGIGLWLIASFRIGQEKAQSK